MEQIWQLGDGFLSESDQAALTEIKKGEEMERKFFLNGQYAIIRTLPRTPELYIESTSFRYQQIARRLENLNRGADYEHYVLRQYFHGKFYRLRDDGSRSSLSPQQYWRINEFYLNLHYYCSNKGRILNCCCSYPYFAAEAIPEDERDGTPERAKTQPVTCLQGDSGRDIENCPNCNRNLYWEDKMFDQLRKNNASKPQRKSQTLSEGDYLVVQTYPENWRLIWAFKSNDYQRARDALSLENMASDEKVYGLRIYSDGLLYNADCDGERGSLSQQQNWQIHEAYLREHRNPENNGEIITCSCSYPHFTYLASESVTGHVWAESQPMTCLVNDNNRDIDHCPNCGTRIFGEEDEQEDLDDDGFDTFYPDNNYSVPATCDGCSNYHGGFYGKHQLICAIHPNGYDGEDCPDYTS